MESKQSLQNCSRIERVFLSLSAHFEIRIKSLAYNKDVRRVPLGKIVGSVPSLSIKSGISFKYGLNSIGEN